MIISDNFLRLSTLSICFVMCFSQSFNQSRELLQTVLKNYDRRLRPNLNQSQPTTVNVSFGILNIEDFDEVNSKFSVTGFLHLTWMDEIINWNPDNNHGITWLMFPVADVWYPVLVLGYAHGKPDNSVEDWMKVRIFYNGNAVLSPGNVYKSTCSADVTYYPFDMQNCSLVFVTWGYSENEYLLQTPNQYVLSDYFIDNGEWEIMGNSSTVGYPTAYSVSVRFILRRKPLFFVVNIILPIMLMSLLNILVFALPPESGERMSYSITVLLAIAVFLTVVSANLPKTSNPMSVLSYFLMTTLIISALVCFFTIMNLRIYFKDNSNSLPVWAHFIIRITCSRYRDPSKDGAEIECNTDNSLSEPNMIKATDTEATIEKRRFFAWTDVGKSIDKICMMFFLLVTVMSSVGFMLFVTRQ